ncbi:MAG: hypothetical protein KDD42_01470, partial [Bdellovibrionales bacterium]|nr:hypothetical protein [Bdellovibrionales bacterium]
LFNLLFSPVASLIAVLPRIILKLHKINLSYADKVALRDQQLYNLMLSSFKEAVRQGKLGILEEFAIYCRDWGFDISKIEVPITFWHGRTDELIPDEVAVAVCKHNPRFKLKLFSDHGHISLVTQEISQIINL